MSKEPTWRDFQEARPKELQKTYKLSDRQLEVALRDKINGANAPEMRKQYDSFYRRNRSDV